MAKSVRYKVSVSVVLAFFVIQCGSLLAQGTQKTQVVIIGSTPFITDMEPNLSPAHLRYVLQLVKPDIIAVDVPVNAEDGWKLASMDATKVVKPFAEEKGIRLASIGYRVSDYDEQVETMLRGIRTQGEIGKYTKIEDNMLLSQKAFKQTFTFINSDDHDNIWRTYYNSMAELYGKKAPWQTWNEKITLNLAKLALDNPGKRIAVVINSPHCYYLKDVVLNQPELTLLSVEKSLEGMDQAKINEYTFTKDHLNALRLLTLDNFGQLPTNTLLELETHLQKINQYPEYRDDANFFRGKMLMHRRKFQRAINQFLPMTYFGPEQCLKYDGVTPIHDTALIYIAIAKMELGDVESAMRDLTQITVLPDIREQTRLWAGKIMQGVYQGNQNNSVDVNLDEIEILSKHEKK